MAQVGAAYIPVRADMSQFNAGVTAGTKQAGSSIANFVKGAAGAMAGLFAAQAVGNFFGGAIEGAREAAKVTALTEQVIKSMGGASGLTAKQVADMSAKLSGVTGIDDEVIQGGANLLLTFGNFSSKGGVFDRTLALANDMSVALGQDMKSSSIQLGKALNDPIKGVTALTRVGVSFTEQQKDQIRTLVESGDILGAQNVILAEVGRQFGGAAAAATTPTEKLKVTLGNLQEEVGARVIPMIDKFATFFVKDLIPAVSGGIDWVQKFGDKFPWLKDLVIPALVAMGAAAILHFGAMAAAAVSSAVTHGVQVAIMVGKWVFMSAQSVIHAAVVVASWVATGAGAVAAAVVATTQVGIQVAKWVFLGAQSVIHAATVVASWVATGAAAVAAAVVAVAQVAIQIARWIALGVVAMAQAAIIAAAWLISMGPIALVVLAIVGLAVAVATNFSTIKNAVITGVQFVVDKFLWFAESIVGAAASAFGWIPGLGPKLRSAEEEIGKFRDSVNAKLEGIKDRTVRINVELHSTGLANLTADQIRERGDGPGAVGGRTLARVRNALTTGTYITSTYRTPAQNRAVGGSPTSYHLDRNNPAVDIGGRMGALDALHARLKAMGGWRELLWRVKGHYDHIHVAHSGGYVTPQGIAPLRSDELLTKLQVGETVLTAEQRALLSTGGSMPDPVVWGRQAARALSSEMRLLARAT